MSPPILQNVPVNHSTAAPSPVHSPAALRHRSLRAEAAAAHATLLPQVPFYRSDCLSACDEHSDILGCASYCLLSNTSRLAQPALLLNRDPHQSVSYRTVKEIRVSLKHLGNETIKLLQAVIVFQGSTNII